MRIDHVALYAKDLEKLRAFYMDFFGAESSDRYHNPQTGLRTYFLTFDGSARLELMSRPDVEAAERPCPQMGYTHLAMSLEDREKVNWLTERLRQGGYQVVSGPRETGDGYYESCVLDPEGNQLELVAQRLEEIDT